MDNEKRYYIRCETHTSFYYCGPYALNEVDAKTTYFDDEDTRVSVWEYFDGNWYWNAWNGWHEGRRHLADPVEDRLAIERLSEHKRLIESRDFSRLDREPQEDDMKPVSSNPFFSQDTVDCLQSRKWTANNPDYKYGYMLITSGRVYYGVEWSFEDSVERQKEEYARGNRYILFAFANGEWYYFPTENEKGVSQWEEETVASQAHMKACSTSTTKTCTYIRLAVKQRGKNRS